MAFAPMPEIPQKQPSSASLAEWMETLKEMWGVVRRVLQKARETQKRQADKERAPQGEFKVGDSIKLLLVI